jgi:hypothetical protein
VRTSAPSRGLKRAARLTAILLAWTGLVPYDVGAALNMSEGLWETTLTADGEPRSLGTRCYTAADVAEMERVLQGKSVQADGACRYSDFAQSGDSITYTMTCRVGDDEQTSAVAATYRGDSATGTLRTAGVTVTTTSRRVGGCTKSSFVR